MRKGRGNETRDISDFVDFRERRERVLISVHTVHLCYACRQAFMRVYIMFYMRLGGLWARGVGERRAGYAA